MTHSLDTANEQLDARRGRWRAQPLRQIFCAWAGVLWAAPIVSGLAILVASAMHAWELDHSIVIVRFLGMTIYNTFMFVFVFSWNVIPLTFAMIIFARHRDVALGLAFWFALILVHLIRFMLAANGADLFFSGLTGPGIGPSLDVLCPPDTSELEFKCAKLAEIEKSIRWVTACLGLILFVLDVLRVRGRVGNSRS